MEWVGSGVWRCARPWAPHCVPEDDPRRQNRLDVVHINELKGDPASIAHLLEFDSIQGRWRTAISSSQDAISVGGQTTHR